MIRREQRGDCFVLTGIAAEENPCLLAIGVQIDETRGNKGGEA